VAEKIRQLYPNDQATGFDVGDIRGAFSIIQPLDKPFEPQATDGAATAEQGQ